ncbi:sensor histidine kinase [Ornithinimicrobium cerasi]|uniref:GAF domain-containing protein n=1 Tax=Ornithinimicrobium cerasi TaxID=2248773 RepID=A0A285VI63_9MICO|nr:GAF domain-containing sensor histidine kinase [Ornithinimicrobium cerasi]SOC53759.1 GAF domain-containing protein [Ornithinimicrobium cerasi]
MTGSLLRASGVALAGATAALLLAVVVVGSSVGMPLPAPEQVVWFAGYLVFPVVGVVLVWHRPRMALGWVYLAVGPCVVLGGGLSAVAEQADATGRTALAAWALLLSNVGFGTAFTLAVLALLLFPVATPRRWRGALLLATGTGYAAMLTGYSVQSQPISEELPLLSPLAVAAWGPWPRLVGDAASLGLVGVAVAALVLLVSAWRRSRGEDRARLAWLGFGAVVTLLALGVGAAVVPQTRDWVGGAFETFAVVALPLATAVGVLRAGLFDITAVLDRTIVYAVLTGIVLATYFGSLIVVTGVLGTDAGRAASLLASAVVAVFLAPVKAWLDRLVERWLYGERAQPYRVLADLAARLERTTALDDLIATVTETVRRTLRLPFVDVVLEPARLVSPSGALALPLVAHGRSEGALVVGRRPGQAAFTGAELRLLEDLARQVAREVRVARLATDLQDSRERLVRAREDERLRVRRDLHDGIGPTLAAAGLQVDALRERWSSDDPRVDELLCKVREEIEQSVRGVRDVVDGLRPPALDDLGLVGVVREHVHALAAAGLEVDLRCPPTLEVGSAAVEVAAYRIVTEALTNVVRHAGATRCWVELGIRDGWLLVEVGDDGTGQAGATDGIGTASMRERATELGGTLEVRPGATGGTTVTARVPIGGGGR